jgi:predicted nucleic acid-binding protein
LPKNVYLDVCSLCRPYDDQSFLRIRLETVAVSLIFSAIERNAYLLVYSSVHVKELSAMADQVERFQIFHLLRESGKFIVFDKQAGRKRAEELVSFGLGPADAAHVTFAEIALADFVTCDDRLAKKCRRLDLKVWAGNPVSFCEKEGLK